MVTARAMPAQSTAAATGQRSITRGVLLGSSCLSRRRCRSGSSGAAGAAGGSARARRGRSAGMGRSTSCVSTSHVRVGHRAVWSGRGWGRRTGAHPSTTIRRPPARPDPSSAHERPQFGHGEAECERQAFGPPLHKPRCPRLRRAAARLSETFKLNLIVLTEHSVGLPHRSWTLLASCAAVIGKAAQVDRGECPSSGGVPAWRSRRRRGSWATSADLSPNECASRVCGRRTGAPRSTPTERACFVQSGDAARAAATASSRVLTPSARNRRRTWFLTVSGLK